MAAMTPDRKMHAPTAQSGDRDAALSPAEQDWMERARSAFYSSTSFMDTNYRKGWEDSIRAFNSQHPQESKYNNPAYEKRSRVFRPKTRTVIRKNEAAAAAAFFSNVDVVSVTPNDPSSKAQVASAEIIKQLLQHRLTKDIPWYQTIIGALQDAQVSSVACAHIRWEYKEAPRTERAMVESHHEAAKAESAHPSQAMAALLDKAQQALELVGPALEGAAGEQNQVTLAAPTEKEQTAAEYPAQGQLPAGALRATGEGLSEQPSSFTAAAVSVEEEPVKVLVDKPVVELLPVENLRIDPGASWIDPINSSPFLIHLIPMYVLDIKDKMDTGEWRAYGDAVIAAATESKPDSTRLARQKDRDDPYGADARSVDDYEVVWVQRHIHRRDDTDWEFYTLGDQCMLTEVRPLSESVLHGKRPYVMGVCTIESHRLFPSTVPQLSRGLQEEINEVANQRLDNVKFVLNKKFLVKRGKEADIAGLLRNVPGGVAMLDNPQDDVRELNWPDVTASSFQEHQGLSMEMDDLLGNFNPAQMMAITGANGPARNMAMLSGANGTLVEYMLRTFVETFVQPVLRQLVLLEQHYESDTTVLRIAAQKAQLFQRFGMDEVTDELLRNEVTLTVNVGMGATDPMQKLNKFLTAMSTFTGMMQHPTPGINMQEVGKEIFGTLGYSDGSRFFTNENPQVLQLQQQLQQAQGIIQQLQQKVKEKQTANAIAQQKIIVDRQTKLETASIREQAANQRALATHWRALNDNHLDHMQALELQSQRNQQPVLRKVK